MPVQTITQSPATSTTVSPAQAARPIGLLSPQTDYQRSAHVTKDHHGGRDKHVPSLLTRKGMEAVHAAGQSVLYGGVSIPPGSPLPDDAELAARTGDESEKERVKSEARAEIERLQARVAALEATPAKLDAGARRGEEPKK